jgi:hypothetical protein
MSNMEWNNRNIIKKKLFVFDWDDTLMPTSFLQLPHYRLKISKSFLQPVFQMQLELLEKKIISVFEHIIKCPNAYLYIVTNAIQNWVESSCEHFMPKLAEYLNDIKRDARQNSLRCPFKIISAQHRYGRKCKERSGWKICTFSQICDELMLIDRQCNEYTQIENNSDKKYTNSPTFHRSNSFSKQQKSPRSVSMSSSITLTENSEYTSLTTTDIPIFKPNDVKFCFPDDMEDDEDNNIYVWDLISIGDGEYEANATTAVTNTINKNNQFYCNVKPKVVKFRSQPTLQDMCQQLESLQKSIISLADSNSEKPLYICDIHKYATNLFPKNTDKRKSPISDDLTPKSNI